MKNEVSQSTEASTSDPDFSFTIMFTLVYLLYCVGHLSYSIYEKFNIYGKLDELANIKADSFLEGLLSEIKARHPDEIYILLLIIFFCCPFGFFIIAGILFSCKKPSKEIEETNLISKK